MATVKGTWRFNDIITDPYGSSTSHDEYFYANFTCPAYDYQFTAFRFIRANYADGLSYLVDLNVGSYGGFNYDTLTWANEGSKTITFTEEQEVSDEFYEWFTANATQQASEEETEETPIATITYKGETLETLNGGEYVTLHTKGKTMEDDIRVEVEEVSGGDIAINGIVEQYKVDAGATVNAGDFVEFVNKYNDGIFCEVSPESISACKLDENRVLVAYIGEDYSNYGTAVVLTVDSNGVSVGETVVFKATTVYNLSAVSLTDSKVLVAYEARTQDTYGGFAVVLTISGTEIEVGAEIEFQHGFRLYYLSAVALTDNKVLVAYASNTSASASDNSLYAVVLSISDTTITKGSVKEKITSSRIYAVSATALTESDVLVAINRGNSLFAIVLSVNGLSITAGQATKFADEPYTTSAVKISENKAFVAYGKEGGGEAVVFTVNGTTVTIGGGTTFHNATAMYLSAVLLSEDKVLVTYRDTDEGYNGYAVVLTIVGAGVVLEDPGAEKFALTAVSNFSAVALSENKALVAYERGIFGAFASLSISNTTITPGSGGSTYVQPATSRLHNVGVAKTSGTEGQMVDVYCVGGESV